jgi:emfourin
MKVILAQHGGQAAGINLNRPPKVIDSAALDEPKAAELKGLVAAATSTPSSATSSGKARDEMSYTITLQDQGRETVLSQSDTTMSADFAKLLAWLQRYPKN